MDLVVRCSKQKCGRRRRMMRLIGGTMVVGGGCDSLNNQRWSYESSTG